MIKFKAIALFCFVLVAGPKPAKCQVNFEPLDFESAIKKAEQQGKYLLVDFRADWCRPCVEMERITFRDSVLGAFVNERYIAIKVEIDSASGVVLKNRYHVYEYPTILILKPSDASVLLTIVGFKPANLLLGDLKAVRD